MTAHRHLVIAAGSVRQLDLGGRDELDAEVGRMERLFERLGYEIVDGFATDMSARELRSTVRAFVTADERTEDDVLVVYYAGGVVDEEDLARWLLADTKIGHVLVVLDNAGPVDTDALRTLCGTSNVIVVTRDGTFTEAFERAVTELDLTGGDRPYVAVADVVHRIGGHHYLIGGERPGPFLPTTRDATRTFRTALDRLRTTRDELYELVTAMRPDAGPLSPAEQNTLLQVVAALGDPGDRVLAALYRQSVERATGQPAPEPLTDLTSYTDLVAELAEYLPGAPAASHPLVECCALLTDWFPDAPGMHELKSVVRRHIVGTGESLLAADPSAIVLIEPGHPNGHFFLTVWCYYGPDDVDLAYRGATAAPVERLRDDLRRELAAAMDRMALRLYYLTDPMVPALVEFIVPVELFGEPVEDWPIGADEPGEERIGWHYPVVLRDLGRCRQPRLHGRWRRAWERMNRAEDAWFTWFGCDANPSRDPAERFFATERRGPVAFTGPPLSGHRRELLGAGLKAGVPAMLWRRDDCVPTAAGCDCGEFAQLIESSMAGTSLHGLPAHVQVFRMTGWHRLALLWDDPSRWPEPPARFADPTRRGDRP
jgi:NTP-dependent ternary conflict system VMAP-like protein/caspase domain-containing protein